MVAAIRHEHPGATIDGDPLPREIRWGTGSVGFEYFQHDPLGLVLIRRGGYAVGLAREGRLVASKAGRRRVQSRTAAGGWSQQRYARRRANQADELVEAVAEHAVRLLAGEQLQGLVVGGDRSLASAVLAEPGLGVLGELPRRELPDLPDPDLRLLQRALWRGRAVWCTGDLAGVSAP
ncbi:MAG TPA: acVLRF1 family peptidyl-tRNA hydrolase [Dermatophilaceae bacterium]|nr:acVLRF1 family peptidyl-tRNA hydrolase [Dermatophilaceae bacterium]